MNSESTLLRSLDPRIFDDHGAAVSFGEGATLSRADLFAAATAVADRIHGAQRVAVQAAAGLETVVAVAGALIAGVAVVPIPPDSGPLERQHIIADSQAELILGDGPSDSSIPLIPIDIHGAICDVLSRTKRGSYRTDHVHLRNHRSSERRCPLASIDRCGSRRARSCVELDARGHTRPRTAPLPRPRVDSRRVGRLARGFAADSYRQTNSGFVCRSGWLVVLRCSDRLVTRVR